MTEKITAGAKTSIRLIVVAFLSVGITQVLLFFGIAGEDFFVKVLVTFVSLIFAVLLLYIATYKKPKAHF